MVSSNTCHWIIFNRYMSNIKKIRLPSGSDVDIIDSRINVSSPSNGEVLTYDSATSKWVNAAAPSGSLPSITGNASKLLAVNYDATGVEWIPNNFKTDYNFVELSAPTISNDSATITFAFNQRNCVEFSHNKDLSLNLVTVKNKSDNYIWITNSSLTEDIDITINSIVWEPNITISDIKGTASFPTVHPGETVEIGVIITLTKARLTSRIL